MSNSRCAVFAAVLPTLLIAWVADAAPLTDGPYVIQSQDEQWSALWVEHEDNTPRVKQRRVRIGSHITVPAVGARPAFEVQLRPPEPGPADEVPLAANTPLFVIADTHGQFEIATELLQQHRIIDKALDWSFGNGHLAVLGDVFDRGPNHTELLWLLYKLEAQARAHGGDVHVLLGNHETLVLLGAREYLHPKYLQTARALKVPAYATLWDRQSFLGRWLRTKPAVQKIGDYLCLHGGVSREVVNRKLTLSDINHAVRNVLDYTEPYSGPKPRYDVSDLALLARSSSATAVDLERAGFVTFGKLSPLWYRGYFEEAAREVQHPLATPDDISAIHDFYDVETILVGHTIVPTITPLYDGRVIAVQVYPRRDEQTGRAVMEGLSIQNGEFFRARIDGTREQLNPATRATVQ